MTVIKDQPRKKIAVVLFNLGGPDGPKAVQPFLYNLFSDKAIIGAPAGIRQAIALLISTLRNRSAQANYNIMGGGSPILPQTQSQAEALGKAMADRRKGDDIQLFIAMRYWHPFTHEVAKAVEAYGPDEIILLPLYPQFSTTTTGSSVAEWNRVYRGSGQAREICCYPTLSGVVEAHAKAIERAFEAAGSPSGVRLLFSAHGLPEKIIDQGDPYQSQIEATAAAVAARLGPSWDWQICYQSRVGPLKWIGPTTPGAIAAAAEAGLGVIVTPIAFVSEHIETLVELDHEYAELAQELGCAHYIRVPALGTDPIFIEALADLAVESLQRTGTAPCSGWACAAKHGKCPHRVSAA
jgi:protoporphyrin/coproporphyrin ferrochelatase